MSFLRASALPASALERIRFTLLVLAVGVGLLGVPAMLGSGHPLVERIAAVVFAFGLCAHWIRGYRAGGFPLWAEPLEAGAIFLILAVTPGSPFLPLVGLMFRSVYGSFPLSLARYLMYVGVLLAAHADRGAAYMTADLGRALGLAVVPAPLQALRAALERLQASERRLSSLVANSTDVVTVVDGDLRVRWQAQSIRAVLGHAPEEMLGSDLLAIVHPEDRRQLEDYVAQSHGLSGHTQRLSLRLRHSDGAHRHFEIAASDRQHDPSVGGYVLNMRDATERHELEASLRAVAAEREYDAMHDPLTGLANRRRLYARLHELLAQSQRDGTTLALLLIDLDRFKELNDTLGHHAGDELLRELRPRLMAAAPGADLVSRLGGDEFAILLAAGADALEAQRTAHRLRLAVERPFHYQGLTLLVRASVGIALFPDHATDVEQLVQRADVAVYSAKAHGSGHELYDAARDGHSRERLALIGELPDAIAGGELVVYYQPKFALTDGHMSGVEALVRWQHPRLGLLGPGAFLPLAEQTGLMRPLTLYVLEDALQQTLGWRRAGFQLPVAVNLGAPNLLDAALPSDIARLLRRFDVAPSLLQLEITETMVSADPEHVIEVLEQLRALGLSLSLDDFGTGSSSLSFLRRLPVAELKIDKSFILSMGEGERDTAIVATINDLAHNLGLETVAEGIETEAVRALVAELGCDHGQGFLMARPMPAQEILALARASVPPPAGAPEARAA